MRASSVSRARTTWCGKATSCTSASTCSRGGDRLLVRVHRHPVAAGALGGVERRVGPRQQTLERIVAPARRHADRERHQAGLLLAVSAADAYGGDGGADLLGERARAGERDLLQQQGELIAPWARRDVAPLDVRLQRLADRPQDLVPEQMTVLVVDLLEVIDVGQHQRAALEGAAGCAELLYRELEAAPVLQSRERIVQRLALGLLELAGEELDLAGPLLEL